jgi:hypothetical protein
MSIPLSEHERKVQEAANYQCDFCGATKEFPARDCCDECILKFYLEDTDAPALLDWKMQ